ncbi:MAG: hypothetical protein OER22_06940 [Gammaproteobacteria bacterium]|nr:hypothetical protein [Gammaproteobacteria bacterium]MDH3373319.1 hypothetical protein [Gammaproteobacteria bacterium]MDH3408158.1 hypothetical protein [Gammaproteobacteria bacterium]MDH3552334.1 hypothetical protein [Gammaproteobacteria bacterium]
MASIRCEASVPRSGLFEVLPSFEVDPTPNPFYAVEIASDPRLFVWANRRERDATNFFASWQDNAPLRSAQRYRPPAQAWNALKNGHRLYYRAWTSADPGRWQDFSTTTPDSDAAAAPFARVFSVFHLPTETDLVADYGARSEQAWRTASRLPEVRRLASLDNLEVVIHPHPFTIGRFDPRTAEWVVIVKAQETEAQVVRTTIARLDFQTLQLVEVHTFDDPQRPVSDVDATATMRRNAPFDDMVTWLVAPDRLNRLGTLRAFEGFAGDFGGVQIVDSLTGRLVYSASTVWNGRGRHLVP